MDHRFATTADVPLLAQMNQQLIRDEGHRNRMTLPELEARMAAWLAGEYTAALFAEEGQVVAYALYRHDPDSLYLRQFFVVRERRRQGIGRRAMRILLDEVWPRDVRLTVEVLARNTAAWAFWRSVGYQDYSVMLEIVR
jgi:GNAT superfamily N-acetyltransferase